MQSVDSGPTHVKHDSKHYLHSPPTVGYSEEFSQGSKQTPFVSISAGNLILLLLQTKQSAAVPPTHIKQSGSHAAQELAESA